MHSWIARCVVHGCALNTPPHLAMCADCASDAAFHPSGAILALGTGQRHFEFERSVDDGDDSDCKDEPMGQDVAAGAAPAAPRNSVSLWRTSYEFAVADESSASGGGGGATADVDVSVGAGAGGGVGEQPSA